MKKAKTEAEALTLEAIPNIGPRVANDLRQLGIRVPANLKGLDPYVLYQQFCAQTGVIHDPCLLDTFIAATRFMSGEGARPWWHYTEERKRTFQASTATVKPTRQETQ
jgi:hypothetical protein